MALTSAQIDAAKRILSHAHRRSYGPGSIGTTVRALKIFLTDKGYDPGPLNARWDEKMSSAFEAWGRKSGQKAKRATPAVLAAVSKSYGKPGPRQTQATPAGEKTWAPPAARKPMQPGFSMDVPAGADEDNLASALGQPGLVSGEVPPYSGMGPGEVERYAPSGEEAYAAARGRDRAIDRKMGTKPSFEPAPGENYDLPSLLGPGPQTDPYAQGFGQEDVSGVDQQPFAIPPGEASMGAAPGASATMQMPPMGMGPAAPGGSPPVPPSGDIVQPGAPGVPPPPLLAQQDRNRFDTEAMAPPPSGRPAPMPPAGGGDALAEAMSPPPLPPGQASMGAAPGASAVGDLGDIQQPAIPPGEAAMGGALGAEASGSLPLALGAGGAGGGGGPGGHATLPGKRTERGDLVYTIQPGDTLWGLAEEAYGDPTMWPVIARANPQIKDPNRIYYGRQLVIPAAA